jgi:hypothetical protein
MTLRLNSGSHLREREAGENNQNGAMMYSGTKIPDFRCCCDDVLVGNEISERGEIACLKGLCFEANPGAV